MLAGHKLERCLLTVLHRLDPPTSRRLLQSFRLALSLVMKLNIVIQTKILAVPQNAGKDSPFSFKVNFIRNTSRINSVGFSNNISIVPGYP